MLSSNVKHYNEWEVEKSCNYQQVWQTRRDCPDQSGTDGDSVKWRFLLLCIMIGHWSSSRGMSDDHCEFSRFGNVVLGVWQFLDCSIKVKNETKYLQQPYNPTLQAFLKINW